MSQAPAKAANDAPVEGIVGFSCGEEVAQRIARLYGDERLADIIFVVQQYEDGPIQRFVGHRNIISMWSEVLKSMLCGDFKEGHAQEVHIRDVEPAAFEAMLKLMYCGTAEITFDNVLAILDVSVRFDVAPLVQFCVQFLQNHTSSEHACRMLEVGVQYGLTKLMDKCIELIVTDDHILESEDFYRLPQSAVIELAKHDSWNLHEDEVYDTMIHWADMNAERVEDQAALVQPILDHIRYPHMSVEKLKKLTGSGEVPNNLIFDALFFKLHHSGPDDTTQLTGRYRPRPGSLLFSWVPTSKVTVSGDFRENARHTSSNGFTGVRGDRRMQHGLYSWTVNIAETQSSWIFVGVAQADDPNDVAWRSTGRMLYCLDSRFFHQGSGQNHPHGDRKIGSGTNIRITLDCTRHTLAFGINAEKPLILFRDLAPVAYVPAVDLRDCSDKVRLVGCDPQSRVAKSSGQDAQFNAAVDSDSSGSTAQVQAPTEQRRITSPAILSGSSAQTPALTMQENLEPGVSSRSLPGELPMRGRPLSNNEVHAALGIHHPVGMGGGSNARMSQPRQSQGSQGGGIGSAVMMGSNFDRMAGPPLASSLPMEPLQALLEEDRESSWEPQGMDFRNDSVPPN